MNTHCFFIGTTLGENPVSVHCETLARELIGRGHRCVLLTPHRRVDLENHAGNPAVYTWPSERPTKWRDARFLRGLIRQFKPSCLIANFASVNVMMTQGWLCRIPVRVAWYHTITSQIEQDHPQSPWKAALLRVRKRFIYSVATRLAANSHASARDARDVFGIPESKIQVFHNALADPMNEDLIDSEIISGRIVCVGRFDPSKGQDVLIRALPIVCKKIPSAHVEFIGEGSSMETCKQLAARLGILERCTFSGQVGHGEVLRRMSTAVATVVPSRSEAFGLVNIESMAVGTPVIASNVGGIPEIVRDGVDGLLVPPDNPAALVAALKTILSDSHLRREMHNNARQRFLSEFELTRAVRKQADWLENELKKHG